MCQCVCQCVCVSVCQCVCVCVWNVWRDVKLLLAWLDVIILNFLFLLWLFYAGGSGRSLGTAIIEDTDLIWWYRLGRQSAYLQISHFRSWQGARPSTPNPFIWFSLTWPRAKPRTLHGLHELFPLHCCCNLVFESFYSISFRMSARTELQNGSFRSQHVFMYLLVRRLRGHIWGFIYIYIYLVPRLVCDFQGFSSQRIAITILVLSSVWKNHVWKCCGWKNGVGQEWV